MLFVNLRSVERALLTVPNRVASLPLQMCERLAFSLLVAVYTLSYQCHEFVRDELSNVKIV
jgi:hypothetical protein